MNLPTTSVIVVSWQRPDALVLCLQSLVRQRLAPLYEIIDVADAAGLAAVASLPNAAQMKLVACDHFARPRSPPIRRLFPQSVDTGRVVFSNLGAYLFYPNRKPLADVVEIRFSGQATYFLRRSPAIAAPL